MRTNGGETSSGRDYDRDVGLRYDSELGPVETVDIGFDDWLKFRGAIGFAADGPVDYQCRTNLDAGFARPYQPGDRLVKGWSGALEPGPAMSLEAMAAAVFDRHDRDDRPDGQLCPSMSIGDVVMFGEVALSVGRVGFVAVRVAPGDLITDRSWRQALDDSAPSTARSIVDVWSRQASAPDVAPAPSPHPELGR